MKKIFILFLMSLLMLTSVSLKAQYRYCTSYEDFVADRWQPLDSIYFDHHSKSRQIWIGGNEYSLTSDDKATKKILKKQAFAVMKGDTLYVNCRNLRFEKTRFGGGYTKAVRIGRDSLLFVNRIIGKAAQMDAAMSGYFFGALGGGLMAASQVKQQVCYLITSGANAKGKISISLIDDDFMHPIVKDDVDLHTKYYSETEHSKRIRAVHILPILKQAGYIE
ncbi:MAG: hypothetical protein J6P64_04765 [Bacteroidales bacterium]|nr:hypothetical protein [Bacteroidales bacterium]